MPTYETLLITVPNLTDEEEQTTVDGLAQIVTDGGGSMHDLDRMGRRRLAYPIRKFEDGAYVRFLYDAESEVPKELERRVRLSDRILRSLTVRMEEEWAEASKAEAVEAHRRAEIAAVERAAAAAKAAEAAEAEAKEKEKAAASEAAESAGADSEQAEQTEEKGEAGDAEAETRPDSEKSTEPES